MKGTAAQVLIMVSREAIKSVLAQILIAKTVTVLNVFYTAGSSPSLPFDMKWAPYRTILSLLTEHNRAGNLHFSCTAYSSMKSIFH